MIWAAIILCGLFLGYMAAKEISGWRYRRDMLAARYHFEECARLGVTPWRRSEHTQIVDSPCVHCGSRGKALQMRQPRPKSPFADVFPDLMPDESDLSDGWTDSYGHGVGVRLTMHGTIAIHKDFGEEGPTVQIREERGPGWGTDAVVTIYWAFRGEDALAKAKKWVDEKFGAHPA